MIIQHLCILFFIIPQICTLQMASDPNSYGPYTAKWRHYESCRGPKSRNLTAYNTALLADGDNYTGELNYTFLANVRVEEVKIFVFNVKGERNTPLWNYKVDNPCQHFAFGPLMEQQGVSHNCVIKKGKYNYVVNFTELSRKFFGPSFFYGDYFFRVVVLCKAGNITCLHFRITFVKKN